MASGLSGANAIAGAVTAANTAFLTQITAFVSAPGNPPPDSEGAGVWVRNVFGDLQRIPVIWQHSLHVCNNGRIRAA
jgi:hypothetical protein